MKLAQFKNGKLTEIKKGDLIEIKKEYACYLTDVDVYRALKKQVGDFKIVVDANGIYIELV